MKEKNINWEVNVIDNEDEINLKNKSKVGKLFRGFLVLFIIAAIVTAIAAIGIHIYKDKEFSRLLSKEMYDEAYEYYMEHPYKQDENIKILSKYLIDKEYEYATSKKKISDKELEKFWDLILKFETEIKKKDSTLYLDLNNFVKPEVIIKLGYSSYDIDLEGLRWYKDECYYYNYYNEDYELLPYKYKYERYDLSNGKVQNKDVDIVVIDYDRIELINSDDEAVLGCYNRFDRILKEIYSEYNDKYDIMYDVDTGNVY